MYKKIFFDNSLVIVILYISLLVKYLQILNYFCFISSRKKVKNVQESKVRSDYFTIIVLYICVSIGEGKKKRRCYFEIIVKSEKTVGLQNLQHDFKTIVNPLGIPQGH